MVNDDAELGGRRQTPGATWGFSVEIGVKPSDVPIGYEYTTKENVKADIDDPLAQLRETTQKTLPAPKAKSK